MTVFDITTHEKSKVFLSTFLKVDIDLVERYIRNNVKDCNAVNFLNDNNIELEKTQRNNLQLVVQHVTTSFDECHSLKKYGILNLQQSLTMETAIKQYLESFDISFDILNKWMSVKGEKVDTEYKSDDIGLLSDSQKHRICRVAHKLYYDYQISGFFCMENETAYGGRVHERPEFLSNLKNLFKANIIEDQWKKSIKPYLITFKAGLDSFAWYSFYNNKYEYEEDYFEKEELKRWLIQKALNVVWDKYHYNSSPEIFAYMKPEVIIPPSDFLSLRQMNI